MKENEKIYKAEETTPAKPKRKVLKKLLIILFVLFLATYLTGKWNPLNNKKANR